MTPDSLRLPSVESLNELRFELLDFRPHLLGQWQARVTQRVETSKINPLSTPFGRSVMYISKDCVIRPYVRGGLFAPLLKDRYFSPNRFEQEWRVHAMLFKAGFPTPEPVGFAFRQSCGFYQGLFISKYFNGTPWPKQWTLSPQVLEYLETSITKLSQWGIWAPDLNAANILVSEDSLTFIDWDKAVVTSGGAHLMDRYKKRLLRSLIKLGAPMSLRSSVSSFAFKPL